MLAPQNKRLRRENRNCADRMTALGNLRYNLLLERVCKPILLARLPLFWGPKLPGKASKNLGAGHVCLGPGSGPADACHYRCVAVTY